MLRHCRDAFSTATCHWWLFCDGWARTVLAGETRTGFAGQCWAGEVPRAAHFRCGITLAHLPGQRPSLRLRCCVIVPGDAEPGGQRFKVAYVVLENQDRLLTRRQVLVAFDGLVDFIDLKISRLITCHAQLHDNIVVATTKTTSTHRDRQAKNLRLFVGSRRATPSSDISSGPAILTSCPDPSMHCGAPWPNWSSDFVFHCARAAAREARSEDDLAVVLAGWTTKFRWAVYLRMTNNRLAVLGIVASGD